MRANGCRAECNAKGASEMKTARTAVWILVVGMVLLAKCPWAAGVVTNYWQDKVEGDWTNVVYWNPQSVPTNTDWAYLSNGVVNIDQPGATCQYFYVSSAAGNFATCNVSAGLYCVGNVIVGKVGHGTLNLSAGTLTCAATPAYLGQNAGSTGVLTQTGGKISGSVSVGMTGVGVYNLQGGLCQGAGVSIPQAATTGSGSMVQTGGTNQLSPGSNNLRVNIGAGASTGPGYYEISGGTLDCRANLNTGGINVGGANNIAPGIFKIIDTNAVIKTGSYFQNATGTLDLVMGTGGISTIQAWSNATLDGTLTVDFGSYAGSATSIVTVINASNTLSGVFSATNFVPGVWITNATVIYDDVNGDLKLTGFQARPFDGMIFNFH